MELTSTYQEPNRDQKRTVPYSKGDKESAGVRDVSGQALNYVRYVL